MKKVELIIAEGSLPELIDLEHMASHAYFNTGNPIMSDDLYDQLVLKIQRLDPENPILKRVGSPDPSAKVDLAYQMPSLNKIRDDKEVKDFLKRVDGDEFVVMDKLDGVSVLIESLGNDHFRLFTRGDGTRGRDISHLAPHLTLPVGIKRGVFVRGELIIPKKYDILLRSESTRKDSFNLRNVMSGIVNTTNGISNLIGFVRVIAYELIGENVTHKESLKTLFSLNFSVVPYRFISREEINNNPKEMLGNILDERRIHGSYEIDGLVIAPNTAVLERPTEKNPLNTVAFKKNISTVATVKTVEWQKSRHGYLKPVVIIEPLKLTGVVVTKVTGHNAKYIMDNMIGPGAKIEITRSGDVIPYIVSVIEPAGIIVGPKEEWTWNETMVDAIAAKKTSDEEVQRIAWFFSTLGAEGIKSGVVARLYNGGLTSIFDFLNATPNRISNVDGFQMKSSLSIHEEIRKAITDANLVKLMYASGCFGRGIGKSKLEILISVAPEVYKIMDQPRLLNKLSSEILIERGVSEKTARSLYEGFVAFVGFFDQVRLWFNHVLLIHESSRDIIDGPMNGKVILFTGFRDKDLEQRIVDLGGEVAGSYNKTVNLLVTKTPDSTSSKVKKAQKDGVEIMDQETFRKNI